MVFKYVMVAVDKYTKLIFFIMEYLLLEYTLKTMFQKNLLSVAYQN